MAAGTTGMGCGHGPGSPGSLVKCMQQSLKEEASSQSTASFKECRTPHQYLQEEILVSIVLEFTSRGLASRLVVYGLENYCLASLVPHLAAT